VPVLQRLLEDRVIEADDTGHFRLMKHGENDSRNKKRVWLAPAFRTILQQSGRNFGTIDLDKEPETKDQMASTDSLFNYQANPEFPRDNTIPA
jgi:hypothetical protein